MLNSDPTGADPSTRAAIDRLNIEHAHFLDHGLAHRVPELYTETGRLLGLASVGIGEDCRGRDELSRWATQRAAKRDLITRHVCTNLRVETDADGSVRSSCYVTVYRAPHPDLESGAVVAQLIAEYQDYCVEVEPGVWRFEERRIAPVFIGAPLLAAIAQGSAGARA